MTKTDLLFIRACKSSEPKKRLRSVHRRFYASNIKNPDKYIIVILARIIDKHPVLTPSIEDLVCQLSPSSIEFFYRDDKPTYTDRTLTTLISLIRFAKVQEIEGFIPPLRFRQPLQEVAT